MAAKGKKKKERAKLSSDFQPWRAAMPFSTKGFSL